MTLMGNILRGFSKVDACLPRWRTACCLALASAVLVVIGVKTVVDIPSAGPLQRSFGSALRDVRPTGEWELTERVITSERRRLSQLLVGDLNAKDHPDIDHGLDLGIAVPLVFDSSWVNVIGGINQADLVYGDYHGEAGYSDKLLASDGTAGDDFGISLSLSGDTALIGADFDSDNGTKSGSAYIFERDADGWGQVKKLLPSDGAAEDNFGVSVSLSGDTALVGAYLDDDNGSSSGSVYVFERDAG
jgi:hypothetical protein